MDQEGGEGARAARLVSSGCGEDEGRIAEGKSRGFGSEGGRAGGGRDEAEGVGGEIEKEKKSRSHSFCCRRSCRPTTTPGPDLSLDRRNQTH